MREIISTNKLAIHCIRYFYNDPCSDFFNEVLCHVGDNDVITRSSNKRFKLLLRNTNLEIQNLSYVGVSTWSSFSDNLKYAISVNSFKINIMKYSLKKLGDAEADLYSFK